MKDNDKGYGLLKEEEQGYENFKFNLSIIIDTCTTIINEILQCDKVTASKIDAKEPQLLLTLNNSSNDDEIIGLSLLSSEINLKIST